MRTLPLFLRTLPLFLSTLPLFLRASMHLPDSHRVSLKSTWLSLLHHRGEPARRESAKSYLNHHVVRRCLNLSTKFLPLKQGVPAQKERDEKEKNENKTNLPYAEKSLHIHIYIYVHICAHILAKVTCFLSFIAKWPSKMCIPECVKDACLGRPWIFCIPPPPPKKKPKVLFLVIQPKKWHSTGLTAICTYIILELLISHHQLQCIT